MPKDTYHGPLERVDECCWRIPKSYKAGMRVDGLIFADERLLEQLKKDQAAEQVANVAFLPGIQYASLAMPDIHWGYGFCIGGVCATDPSEGGVISPGGVGYDINCGVRLVRSNLFYRDVKPHLRQLVEELFRACPREWGGPGDSTSTKKSYACSWLKGHSPSSLADSPARATSNTPRPTDDWTGPTPTPSATGHLRAAPTSAEPWAPATTSWRYRS